MDKNGHINYWKETAIKDWDAVHGLLNSGNYVQSLFFAHLTLEKLCKAHWVKDNSDNIPPRIHNLNRILAETDLNPSEEQLQFLEEFNDFQLEGRYPDYKMQLYTLCTELYTTNLLEKVKELKQWLQENLQ